MQKVKTAYPGKCEAKFLLDLSTDQLENSIESDLACS